jgi:hypothetical protein
MSRNKCFSHVRISQVLRFISICDLFADSPLYILSMKPTNQQEYKQHKNTETEYTQIYVS